MSLSSCPWFHLCRSRCSCWSQREIGSSVYCPKDKDGWVPRLAVLTDYLHWCQADQNLSASVRNHQAWSCFRIVWCCRTPSRAGHRCPSCPFPSRMFSGWMHCPLYGCSRTIQRDSSSSDWCRLPLAHCLNLICRSNPTASPAGMAPRWLATVLEAFIFRFPFPPLTQCSPAWWLRKASMGCWCALRDTVWPRWFPRAAYVSRASCRQISPWDQPSWWVAPSRWWWAGSRCCVCSNTTCRWTWRSSLWVCLARVRLTICQCPLVALRTLMSPGQGTSLRRSCNRMLCMGYGHRCCCCRQFCSSTLNKISASSRTPPAFVGFIRIFCLFDSPCHSLRWGGRWSWPCWR